MNLICSNCGQRTHITNSKYICSNCLGADSIVAALVPYLYYYDIPDYVERARCYTCKGDTKIMPLLYTTYVGLYIIKEVFWCSACCRYKSYNTIREQLDLVTKKRLATLALPNFKTIIRRVKNVPRIVLVNNITHHYLFKEEIYDSILNYKKEEVLI